MQSDSMVLYLGILTGFGDMMHEFVRILSQMKWHILFQKRFCDRWVVQSHGSRPIENMHCIFVKERQSVPFQKACLVV